MPRIFITLSVAAHAALGMWVEVRDVPTPAPAIVVDSWKGDGIEVDTGFGPNAMPSVPDVTGASAAPDVNAARNEPEATPVTTERPVTSAARAPATTSRARSARPRTATPARRPLDATTSNVNAEGTAPGATSSGASETAGTPANGTFGAAGLPTGVRHLPKAFTRALGLASRGDPRWLGLPVGLVGEARFRLSLDEEGRLGQLEYDARTPATELAPVLEHLLANTRLLLLSGRFSLDATHERGGAQALRVRVELSDAAPSEPASDPTGLNELEYEAPVGRKPGRGSFRLNSGRRVVGWVYVE